MKKKQYDSIYLIMFRFYRIIYKLFGVYKKVYLINTDKTYKREFKTTNILPRIGEQLVVDNETFVILNIIHIIDFKHHVWLVFDKNDGSKRCFK